MLQAVSTAKVCHFTNYPVTYRRKEKINKKTKTRKQRSLELRNKSMKYKLKGTL